MSDFDNLTKAIESLESAEKSLPFKASEEVRGIVEELIYLRLRVSMGDAK